MVFPGAEQFERLMTGEPMKLTATTVRSARLERGKSETIFFDDEIPGLGLRIREGGAPQRRPSATQLAKFCSFPNQFWRTPLR
jgi:hypothetical protein